MDYYIVNKDRILQYQANYRLNRKIDRFFNEDDF
jgi:hypothetical protein